ncbi:hypothetical protein [Microlunatus speluncae]|uniref:hypothetical protein n=1 Tax=Microlunatus speluncae TaxID=2594267 RepID=UPI0012665B92|nr:hypothetical protein [Microlunatus speluncae]
MVRTAGRVLLSVLVLLPLSLCLWAVAPRAAVAKDEVAFTIGDERIKESSGLATDPDNNCYWTVNDSGDEGRAFALDEDGEVTGTLSFGAEPTDIEAVAMHNGRLYLGDIGDNDTEREFVTVYFFDNPDPDGGKQSYRSYDFEYPDGPRDAEALFVDDDGRLYIVSKEGKGGIYAAPEEPSRQGINELKRVGDAPAFVTDAVSLPDGQGVALRTYVSVEVLDPDSYDLIGRAPLPFQRQGESITVSLDGEKLMVGSEGEKSDVYSVDIPAEVKDAAEGESQPPESKKPSTPKDSSQAPPPSATESAAPPPADNRGGTFFSLGAAAVVALIAGLVVALIKKR